MSQFQLLMLSAMYENGGNVTQRLLDGHPELLVYPFESQLGTRFVNDHLTSMFPKKYRWPSFPLNAGAEEDYKAIIDEEVKVRSRTPQVSKFANFRFDLDDDERHDLFLQQMQKTGRSRGNIVAAFMRSTFGAWKNHTTPSHQSVHVGYSPIIVVDAARILEDFANAQILHIVRNPWSAYADTKKRAVPMPLETYMTAWATVQHHALTFAEAYPDSVHLIRFEDIIRAPEDVLGKICKTLGLQPHVALREPSWNGNPLQEVYPFGTIRLANEATNLQTAAELSAEETASIYKWAKPYLPLLGYEGSAGGYAGHAEAP